MQNDPIYTPEEAAEVLRIGSERTLERWRTEGTGPAFTKVGHRVFYRASSIASYLDRQTRQHTNETKKR